MELIKVVEIKTSRQALKESIKIWKRISESPDGTLKRDIVEGGYSNNCPLCELFGSLSACPGCPISFCLCGGEPYVIWQNNPTTENAKRVLEQLEEKLGKYEEVEI